MRSKPIGGPRSSTRIPSAAQLGLGNTLKTVGRQAEAIEAYRRATVLRAGCERGLVEPLEPEDLPLRGRRDRRDGAPARTRRTSATRQRVQFSFALAKAREDRGEYARAFELYAAGNRARRALEHYDPVQTEVINERIRAVFTAEFLARHARAAAIPIRRRSSSSGLPRSGSTLIEQILSSHSAVDATHELPEVGQLIQQIGRDRHDRIAYPEAVRDFDARPGRRSGAPTSRTRASTAAGRRASLTRTRTTSRASGLLALALPNARIVNARRHPLDTCLSCYRQLFARGQPFTYDLTELGEYYLEYDRMMAHWHAVLPGRVLDVQYEDRGRRPGGPDAAAARNSAACPGKTACLRYWETERAIRTASSEQVRLPIYDSSVSRWRHYEARARAAHRNPATGFAGVWPGRRTWSILRKVGTPHEVKA